MPYADLTSELAREALSKAGLEFRTSDISVEARRERWVVQLPDRRLAWFAASEVGARQLATERRVLRLLGARCSFEAPRVLVEDAAGDFEVRSMVDGESDPWRVYAAVRDDVEIARRIGRAVGEMLAEQHARIGFDDVGAWLPRTATWPESHDWIRERLKTVIDDSELLATADAVMSAYEAVSVSESDCAFVHTDLGLHNLAVDPETFAVNGLFDYEGAAWADRHYDFRYLVFDWEPDELLDAALASYEPLVGRAIERERVLLYNAACAIGFLALRAGTAPEERSAGRTLAEDLRWSRLAIARAGFAERR
jgi:aminoglycoside phosphotransferase (APT) family kinase protein